MTISRPWSNAYPNPGFGLGLRSRHFDEILTRRPEVGWFEIISENFMDSGGRPRTVLRRIAEHYPIVMHGVSLSIGSSDPLDREYLRRLRNLADEIHPLWISDHLCWTGVQGLNSHDLLPLPLHAWTLAHTAARVAAVQDFLGRPLILENPSTYLTFVDSDIPEWMFLSTLADQTGCGILLDVNNVFVSAFNHDFDPCDYIRGIAPKHIVQMHVAGHQAYSDCIIDTHDRPVSDEVWALYRLAWRHTGGVATLLEWDGHIPDLATLEEELRKAAHHAQRAAVDPSDAVEMPIMGAEERAPGVSHPLAFLVPRIAHELDLT